MIRINKNSISREEERRNKVMLIKEKQLRDEFQGVDYNLDESTCIFRINPIFKVQARFIGVSVYVKPLVGLFQGIQFLPVLYFKYETKNYTFEPPRIYNDRRLFHPNISIEDCEIVIPQLFKDWNPSYTYLQILRRLKYVILQPNPHCIPNTNFNRRAAFFYKIRRQKYREEMIKNSPKFLEAAYSYHTEKSSFSEEDMIDEAEQQELERAYFDIDELFEPKKKNLRECLEDEDDNELQLQKLSKEIKKINLNEMPTVQINLNEHFRGLNQNITQPRNQFQMEEEEAALQYKQIKIVKQPQIIYF